MKTIKPRRDLAAEVLPMPGIRKYFTRQEQRNVGARRRIQRKMKSLFRADAPQSQREVSPRMSTARYLNSIFHHAQQVAARQASAPLIIGNAIQKCAAPIQRENSIRIPGWRQMQRGQDRHIGVGEVLETIN